ncbi:MAG: homoaconitate hydratase family protein [Bacteroidia bacterium]|nr:homoaconitate hydratase family protein [Bacteroidia bacterium]
MTIIEKILAKHSGREKVHPGEIVDVEIDVRLARDFGGANVVKHIEENQLEIADPRKTWFTFDCNPTGSDQKYAANQQYCRVFARNQGIHVFDIDAGIGTHLAIDKGLAVPGCTLVSTDSHSNILGAIGSFGQGMGDQDIAAAWATGKVWFKVPHTVKIVLDGKCPRGVLAKDVALNLLREFGASTLLGKAVEIDGDHLSLFTLDQRITISSMATEMGAIAIIFPPSEEVVCYCKKRSGKMFEPVFADEDAVYQEVYHFNLTDFRPAVSMPGKPHDVKDVAEVQGEKIDSVFIGSCTNGRMKDMIIVASILDEKKVAPGVVLKIVPATDEVWRKCLTEGLIRIFKEAGALVGNAGCAGCAAGQIGQNGPGEVTVSTGNRNFEGKQGKGKVYLASPATAAASALAGHITTGEFLPESPSLFVPQKQNMKPAPPETAEKQEKPDVLIGKVWIIGEDNIDTDMIFHNRHLAITNPAEMGQFTFGNLKGWEDYAKKSEPDDMVIVGKNFGSGSSRQQAVDCFLALKNQAILAKSFGAIYERNAINAALPVLVYENLEMLELKNRDRIEIDLRSGKVINLENGRETTIEPFSEVQMQIYKKGGLLSPVKN